MARSREVLPLLASTPSPCPKPLIGPAPAFLLGQASIILLAVLFLRYVVFEQANPADTARQAQKAFAKRRRRASSVSRSAQAGLTTSDYHMLAKLGYDLPNHPSEEADWVNVLLAQAVTGYRNMLIMGGTSGKGPAGFVEKALNAKRSPDENPAFIALDHISVTDVDFGDDFPAVSKARVRPCGEAGRVRVEFELDYSDNVRLAVDTRILVNFPRPRFAVLPVSLGLTLVKLHARLTLEIPPTSSPSPPVLYLSMHPDFTLDLSATSLIGSRAKLQDIPKVEQLIVGRLRSFVVEKLVYPKRIPLKLPAFSHHTGDDEDYVWVADATPDDFGLSQHSAAPSTDEAVDDEDDDEDLTAQLPQPDLDEVVRRPSPRSSPTMLTGGSATALPPRIFHYGSPAFRHRSSASSTISGSEPHLPGYLPRRPAPEPMRAMPPPWRAGEHILRAGSRAMPLPSPSFASGVSTPGFGTFASPVASR